MEEISLSRKTTQAIKKKARNKTDEKKRKMNSHKIKE